MRPDYPTNAAPAPCCDTKTISYVDVLGENLEHLEKSIAYLEQRLYPILKATGPQDACGQLANASCDSRLAELARRAADIRHRLEDITRRIQA